MTTSQRKGPQRANAVEPHVQPTPTRGFENVSTVNTAPVDPATIDFAMALGSIRHAGLLIHAAWMATASLTDDEQGAARESLQAVLHIAGEGVDDAASALKRALVSA
jgi:hypothetical protein